MPNSIEEIARGLTEADEAYWRRAQQALDAAKVKRGEYRGACEDCDFCLPNWLGDKCSHPAVELVAFNLTDAYAQSRIVECAEQRDSGSVWGPVVCGPNGVLFTPRLGFLARLFAALRTHLQSRQP